MKGKVLFKFFCCLAGISLVAGVANAAPGFKISDKKDSVTIQEAATPEFITEIKKVVGDGKDVEFRLEKTDSNDDLARVCDAFPNMNGLNIDQPKTLTSIAPVSKLKSITRFTLNYAKVSDFSPLSNLTTLTRIKISGNNVNNGMMGPDLKWMSKLTNLTDIHIAGPGHLKTFVSFEGIPSLPKLTSATFAGGAPASLEPLHALPGLTKLDLTNCTIADLTPLTKLTALRELSLYGVTVKDFSPLAALPKLEKLKYYATKGADYSTLGKLTQLKELTGGLSELIDISWIANLPNLRKFDVFAENIADLSPLGKAKVEDFQIWDMKSHVDLKQISGAVSIKKLKLWSAKNISGFEGLGSLVNLEELILMNMNAKDGTLVNLAFAKSLVNLKKLQIDSSDVSNFDAVAGCVKLETVDISKSSTGVTSLAALKKLPNLKHVNIPKGMFSDAELAGFAATVNISQR